MGVKLSKLELQEIRKVIPVVIDGKEELITVYNLIGEKRRNYLEELKSVKSDKDLDVVITKQYKKLLREFTDITIDRECDVVSVVNNPSIELVEVQKEIQEIVHELTLEYWTHKISELNQTHQLLLARVAIEKGDKVMALTKELENGESIQ